MRLLLTHTFPYCVRQSCFFNLHILSFSYPIFFIFMCNIIHDFKAVEEVERALLDCMPSDKRTPFLQEIISPQRILHKHRVFMIFC